MSVVLKSAPMQGGVAVEQTKGMLNFGMIALGVIVVASILGGLRLYQGAYAFKFGLDSTTPEFATYWVTLFKVEIPLIFGSGAAIWTYLWMTRDKDLASLDAETELRRYFTLVTWFLVYTFSFLGIASFFGEADATWHQTVIRDTALTPSHIAVFYACVPLYMIFGFSTLMYATTRLPQYSTAYSVPMLVAVIGPGLVLANLGFNEWGHAFWMTEEIFSHPLHWGFTVLGWTGLALGGTLLQIVVRMTSLFRELTAADRQKSLA